jgi:hypothetical protein
MGYYMESAPHEFQLRNGWPHRMNRASAMAADAGKTGMDKFGAETWSAAMYSVTGPMTGSGMTQPDGSTENKDTPHVCRRKYERG